MNKLVIFSSFLAIALIAQNASAATANGTARAEIIAPLTVTSTQNIDFGKMMQPTTSETVLVDASGAVSGASVHLGGHQKGTFTIAGEANTNVNISIGNAVLNGSGAPMTMSTYTFDKAAMHALDATGASTVNFGASLAVAANQTEGVYTGAYIITVNY